MPGHDFSSLLAFMVPGLIVIAVLLVMAVAVGEKPTKIPAAEPTDAELLAREVRELRKRLVLEKGGSA